MSRQDFSTLRTPAGSVKDLEEEGLLAGLGCPVSSDEPSLIVDEGGHFRHRGDKGEKEKTETAVQGHGKR